MFKLNKQLLLLLAVLFMLMLVPTAFASDIDDANAVGVDNQLAADGVSPSPTNDVVAQANDYESDVITAANDPFYVDAFDGSGGSGTSDNPYHSLKNVLEGSVYQGSEINLFPGTYDFGGVAADLYDKDFTLNAMGDVIFTSSETLFHKYGNDTLTLNGIQFRDITSSSSAILYTGSSVEGTLNLNNCSFINNKGTNLIQTSYNIYIKGCNFINNEATGTSLTDGGLIQNVLGSPIIDISYSIFIGNNIHFSYTEFCPLITNGIGSSEPSVYFNNNFVNYNNSVNGETIITNGACMSFALIYITGTAPSEVSAGDTVDLVVNFSRSNLRPLDDYMHDLDVSLVPRVNVGLIPVTITNNGGKAQYTAKNGVSYTEIVDVKYGDNVLTTFEFYVANGDLLNPELTVPTSIIADMGTDVNINATHVGDGIVSYVVADESVATVDANGVVTVISEGITTITVNIAATDTYGEDSKEVKLMVKDPADVDVVYVDGLLGYGGSGIKVDPYHSLLDVIYDISYIKEIRFLPGTYDFENIVDLNQVTQVFSAFGDDVIFTTSSRYMFEVRTACNVTFKGIKFKDSNVDNAVVTRTFSKAVGTLNFIDCDFINNTGTCLIDSSCNVNIKGCKFIDNKATGTFVYNSGLIHNYGASTNTISVTYSVFINNEISYTNYNYKPMIVDWNNGNGPAVIFNYNFVNNNNDINNNAIAYHASSITKAGYTVINTTAPGNVNTRHSADLVVNFTKNGGGALSDYMPNLTIELAPRVKTGSIPVTITNNGGKGKYVANDGNSYWETVDVKVNGNTITNFQFYVSRSNNYETTIAADDLVMSYKDGSAWNATLTDVYGNPISSVPIKIGININGLNKVYSFVTDANGVASLPINLVSGTYDVNATFAGDNRYESSFVSAIVTVNKAVAILTGDNIEMSYKDGTNWAVTLTDLNGNAISGVKVAFGVLSKVYSILTDDNGVAKLPINLISGSYTFSASFSNSKYQAESITATVIVNKAIPVLSAEDLVMSYKDGSAWDVTLTDANGNAMANTYVKFTVSGKTYSRKTNENGVASLPINLGVGTYNISAKYEESSNFNEVEISKSIVVNPPEYEIVADDINMTYQDGTSYTVQLTDTHGNPVSESGVVIKVTICGKSYNLKTNADGIVSLPINLKAGTYEITAEYNGKEITNTIVVIKP